MFGTQSPNQSRKQCIAVIRELAPSLRDDPDLYTLSLASLRLMAERAEAGLLR